MEKWGLHGNAQTFLYREKWGLHGKALCFLFRFYFVIKIQFLFKYIENFTTKKLNFQMKNSGIVLLFLFQT